MSKDVEVRRKYVRLVEAVRVQGAIVHIFRCEVCARFARVYSCSVRHVSGEQLKLLSGVAAILRYPLHDVISDDDDDDDV
jgi:protein pelota